MVLPKPRVILPELPPELWIKIHRFATYVPDLLNSDFALDFSSPSRRTSWKLLRESLVTKRYLVRVCKQWRSLALPFLYESIYVGRGRALSSLSSTLKLSRENQSRHGTDRALGWWTKRIDVVMRDHIGVRGQDRDVATELALLAQIFLLLPNLTIIDFGITATLYHEGRLHKAVLQAIAGTSGSGLEAIVWHVDTAAPIQADWRAFLAETPNIKTIQCPATFFVGTPPRPASSTLELKLHALNNLSLMGSPLPEYLPSLPLRRLCIDFTPDQGTLLQTMLLEKYGGGLVAIQLGEQLLHELPSSFHLVSRTCPNLSRIDLSFYEMIYAEPDWSGLPATIETLGLQFDRSRLSRRVYETLFDSLLRIAPGSKLKAIRLTDQLTVKDLKERHLPVLTRNAGRLAKIGLEVRDHEGHLMHGPLSELKGRADSGSK